MSEVIHFILQFISSLNYRVRGERCPYCGRQISVEYVKLGCCHRLVPQKT